MCALLCDLCKLFGLGIFSLLEFPDDEPLLVLLPTADFPEKNVLQNYILFGIIYIYLIKCVKIKRASMFKTLIIVTLTSSSFVEALLGGGSSLPRTNNFLDPR